MMALLYFRRRADVVITQAALDSNGVEYISNGITLACNHEDAMLILLRRPEIICKSSSDQEFIKRWIDLIRSCTVRNINGRR